MKKWRRDLGILLASLLVGGLFNSLWSATGRLEDRRIIDGSKDPHLISDVRTYSLFFRTLADESRPGRTEYLLKDMQIEDSKELRAAVAEYREKVAEWDARVKFLKDNHWPDPPREVLDELSDLQREKVAFTTDVIASLDSNLGADKAKALRFTVSERLKGNTKVIEGPRRPLGGPGWRHRLK